MKKTATIVHTLGLSVAACSMVGLIAATLLTAIYGKDLAFASLGMCSLFFMLIAKPICMIAWDIDS